MKVVDFKPAVSENILEAAGYLRELAERCEKGEILDVVVVSNDAKGANLERYGAFTDRWRILGALEYAKSTVNDG